MNKLYTKTATLFVAMMIPMIAWADPISAIKGLPEKVLYTLGALSLRTFIGFLRVTVLPHKEYWILSIFLTGFTLVWILGIGQIRRWAGRLWGPVLATWLFISLFNTLVNIWEKATGFYFFLLIVLVVLGGIALLAVAAWVGRKLLRLFTTGITVPNPNIVFCFIGALAVSLFINSRLVSNPKTYYIPSGISALAGLITAVVLIVMWVRKRSEKQQTGIVAPRQRPQPNPQQRPGLPVPAPAPIVQPHQAQLPQQPQYTIVQTDQGLVAMSQPTSNPTPTLPAPQIPAQLAPTPQLPQLPPHQQVIDITPLQTPPAQAQPVVSAGNKWRTH